MVRDIAGVRERLRGEPNIGLVPTMGNLHEGHLALVRRCRSVSASCVVSIFVNPTQFGANEDFGSYPRTPRADLTRLEAERVDVVFAPSVEEMYPEGQELPTRVSVPALSDTLCGASRPGHFDGVATVVAKLFNIVAPQRAFFGEKDWQQLAVIRAMVRQLNMPVEVVGVATVRAASGLALSSRNGYLGEEELERAALLNRCLVRLAAAIDGGRRDYAQAERDASEELGAAGFDVDYVAVRDAHRLSKPDAYSRQLRVLAAARLGGARLIDNVGVDV